MKRYLLFKYGPEPFGGWDDLFASFDDLASAQALAATIDHSLYAVQIIDLTTGEAIP